MKHPIDTAAKVVGSQAALAAALGVTRAAVGQWKGKDRKGKARKVPAEHCPVIERLTKGKVKCEQLRPDVAWNVLREQAA